MMNDSETIRVLPIDQRQLRIALPPRNKEAHKGNFGHTLIIGGDYGMAGAALMAAEACARTGSGKVSVATHAEHIPAFIARRPELMVHAVETPQALLPLLSLANVVVIGPGLGKTAWSHALLKTVLDRALPLVMDADALNMLAQGELGEQRNNWILTPHPGEAARLLGLSTEQIEADRPQAALSLQQRYQGVSVLKGMGSLIACPDALYQCQRGNPGMASGGMGDVLSGIIGGLLAQGLSLEDAACFGVELHGAAADIAAKQDGQRGLLATDLLLPLRTLLNP